MNFTPKSEKECNQFKLLPVGEYEFEIASATDKVSKSGNEMIELMLVIYVDGEPAARIFDYLLESVAYKLRHCADACGLLDKYNSGTLTAQDLDGKTGRCSVAIQIDKTGQYSDKNVVRDYIPRGESKAAQMPVPAQHQAQVPNLDGLPF